MLISIKSYKEACDRITNGECYIMALKVLAIKQGASDEHRLLITLPANTLAGFALELILKGFLLLSGISSHKVKWYRHDIEAIVQKCREFGLPEVDNLDYIVSTLGEGHKNMNYRYINSGDVIDVFNWDLVIPILDGVVSAIGPRYWEQTQAFATNAKRNAEKINFQGSA